MQSRQAKHTCSQTQTHTDTHTHLAGRRSGWPYSQGHWYQLLERWFPWWHLGFQVCSWLWSPKQKNRGKSQCRCVCVCVCVRKCASALVCFVPSRPWGRRTGLSRVWRTGRWAGTSAPTAAGCSRGWSSEAGSSGAKRAATSDAHTNHLRNTHNTCTRTHTFPQRKVIADSSELLNNSCSMSCECLAVF